MRYQYNDGGRSQYFKGDNVKDCAVRAIAIALDRDYKEVYNDLKKLNNGKSCRNGTPKAISKKYLTMQGWKWNSTMTVGSGCKMHLEENEVPMGRVICQLSKHLVAVLDGIVNDTYDCTRDGNRCVYGYWSK